jgi:hypothetical protein
MAILKKAYVNKFKCFKKGYYSSKVVNIKDVAKII